MSDLARTDPAPDTRIDGFVSYSRRDATAVLRLVEEAERQGRSLWLDADDIPSGATWREELGNGIEAADSFLACLSDHWLASTECRKEYDQAVDLGKRLVPVVVGDLDAGAVPAPLAVLQWIPARDRPVDHVLPAVLAAIDVDHARVREHTHWLAIALRWERRGQDRSLLVRGQELRSAEDWLGQPGANPAPTPLQTRFVTASRQAERARLRTLLVIAVATVLVTALLAVVALVQRGEAVAQRKVAEEQRAEAIRQRDTARSRQLASVALGQVDVDPERAVLIAREAWSTSPTDEALAALRTTVDSSYARVTDRAHEDSVSGVAWAGDRVVVSIGLDGRLQATDATDGTTFGEVTLGSGRPQSLAATPSGSSGLALSRAGTVWAWTLGAAGEPVETRTVVARGVVAVAASTSDDSLLAARGDGVAIMVEGDQERTIRVMPPRADDAVTAAAMAGGLVAAGTADGKVYAARDGAPPRLLLTMPAGIEALDLSANGRRLLAAAVTGSSAVVDTRSGQVVQRPAGTAFTADLDRTGRLVVTADINGAVTLSGGPQDLVLSPGGGLYAATDFSDDGSLVAAASLNGGTRVWRTSDGAEVATLVGSSGAVQEVAFAPDRRIATGHGDGDLRVWELPAEPVPIVPTQAGLAIGSTNDVALSPDGRLLAVARLFVDFFQMPSRAEQDPTSCPAPPVGDGCLAGEIFLELGDAASTVVFDAEGDRLAVGSDSGALDLWDLTEGRLLSSAPDTGGHVNDVAFGPDGTWVAQAAIDGLHVVRVDDGEVLGGTSGTTVNAVVVLPDATILSADTRGRVSVSRADATPPGQLVDLHGNVLAAAADPDGSTVAFAMEDVVRLASLEGAGEPEVTTLQAGTGLVSAVAFTGDGQFLLGAGEDGIVRVWDAQTGQLATRITGPGGGILALAPDRTGSTVVMGGQAGTYELRCEVCLPVDDLLELAEHRVTRELSADERERFLGE